MPRTADQLADDFKAIMDEAHALANALEAGPLRRQVRRKLDTIHNVADELKEILTDGDVIQPFSGGEPK